ncbi:hypothetical protein SPONL_66 [uncultured Candidatus Thioglobus sp.]|nr:hypothetical protein SPONL_66 [uncultured Candidatus Thioglobus sp.]
MSRIIISVEGKSEKNFVDKVLTPHLLSFGVYVEVQDMKGNISVDRVVEKLNKLAHSYDYVTTLYDFYGFKRKSEDENKQSLEDKIKQGIRLDKQHKIIPYIQMYEFETLLFSNASIMATELSTNQNWIDDVLSEFSNIEDINNSKKTAPSKRIIKNCVYIKTTHAPNILKQIGLKEIRQKCAGFNNWLTQLESLGE